MAAPMNRIAYFVPIKGKEGMAVGPVSPEQLQTLIDTLSAAKEQGKGIVFFLFRNEPDEKRRSIATLTVAVERDRPQGNYRTERKPIGGTTPTVPKTDPLKNLFGNQEQTSAKKGW